MSFFSPINFLFLLGTIPIIIMYLLKKKHHNLEVSSVYLWQKAVRDIEANTPWQRLRKNILLILQLLAFIMLVFFLVKPYLISDMLKADNLIIVLDKSLSMSALEDDESRFNKAKKEIEDIFKNLKSGAVVTFITMGNSPEIVAGNSKDKSILIDKLKEIRVSNETDNLNDTLSLIKAMTKNEDNYRVIFYTDKNIDVDIDNLILKRIGSPKNNIAIETLSCKKIGDSLGALIDIVNYGNRDVKTDLTIYAGNKIFDVHEIILKANDNKKVYIKEIPNTNIVKAEIDAEDAIRADNVRYCVLNGSKIKKVLMVTTGNIFLEKAITLNENIELYKTNEVLTDVKGYDLYIYDGRLPSSLPTDGNIFILNPSNLDGVVKVNKMIKEGILSVSEDELLRYVDFNISMSKAKILSPPDWAKTFIYSNDEAIGFKGVKGNQKFVVLGFDIHDTDLPLKYSFPIFIQNVLDYTLNLNIQNNTSVLCGQGIEIDVSPKANEVYIVDPSENRMKIAPPFPVSAYNNTNEVGVYTIEQKIENDIYLNYFAVNVNTILESNINQAIEDNDEASIEKNIKKNAMINIKNFFLILALLFLAAEWVVYNRGY
ncbi:vWA domain-containing protein [Paramaledivibacter caminithermalis]|jgi:hypothetical protein|uniref:von Willebrand factor type A domain-containing protein n=1 Tax=Paramaledivibacter caminithermalis (strain DSM 15212 / CIP 107654 / DViRD3) TaxID=1121301 RepID=A0A1M6JMB3_PARC5|nr:BatA and WFA domain-containing protein [Paramaledivibacter caminithermalis]SHJ47773.1 von Willebrand factor type A domain-containing protein [Paramaledivibacter caminithermalis DSM 15212]